MTYVDKNEAHSGFCTEYVHYRTKKLMRISDYGYKCWYFGARSK